MNEYKTNVKETNFNELIEMKNINSINFIKIHFSFFFCYFFKFYLIRHTVMLLHRLLQNLFENVLYPFFPMLKWQVNKVSFHPDCRD